MSLGEFVKRATKNIVKSEEVTEAQIENAFAAYAKQKGCKALKLVFLVGRGFPDRTVLCPGGKIFFIEFKRKGGKLSPQQIQVRDVLTGLGFSYFVCNEKGQAEKTLDRVIK